MEIDASHHCSNALGFPIGERYSKVVVGLIGCGLIKFR
jgi:hypothetical protein